MASFHVSVYGQFGALIPVDLDGLTHTTALEWRKANIDAYYDGEGGRELLKLSLKVASESRSAIRAADAAMDEWRSNCRFTGR